MLCNVPRRMLNCERKQGKVKVKIMISLKIEKNKAANTCFGISCFGTPEGTRTPNFQNRNLTLYPLNYGRIIA